MRDADVGNDTQTWFRFVATISPCQASSTRIAGAYGMCTTHPSDAAGAGGLTQTRSEDRKTGSDRVTSVLAPLLDPMFACPA